MVEEQHMDNALGRDKKPVGCFSCIARRPIDPLLRTLGKAMDVVISSFVWKTLILIFTFVLLFGSPIQFLFTPKSADVAFDILYIFALVIFILDMIINMFLDRDYFGIDPHCKTRAQPLDQSKQCCMTVGSFKMWCDIVSTAALFYDLSFINLASYREEVVELKINENGYFDFNKFNPHNPVELNLNFVILVCKVARVARLIPSNAVVEISSRVNFYWYVERINPLWHYGQFQERREAARREKMRPSQASALSRRSSWRGLDIAAVAKMKALECERRNREKQLGFFSRTWLKLKRGYHPTTNSEVRLHTAAMKIQHAWRQRQLRMECRSIDGLDLTSEDGDIWRGRLGGANALERVLKKRNMLGNYHRQNGRNLRASGDTHHNFLRPATPNRDSQGPRADSQVGSAMAEVTGQWVAGLILSGLILTILFTYHERDATRPSTMVVLHGQIVNEMSSFSMAQKALNASIKSVVPDLYAYISEPYFAEDVMSFEFDHKIDLSTLRDRELLRIIVTDSRGKSEGIFVNKDEKKAEALVELLMTIFVLILWFLGVAAFAGPVMTLVITPIERMVRLLGMLTVDPLGYQTNSRFKKFMFEEDAVVKKSQWTKEVLKGMETSFLMSTILRIGSLMKVGFGSAGVEIIRHNLQQGQNKNLLILNSQGSMVSCIFLFCDVRQFTDATECLQEEVFVFTNRIAAVVHSICHSCGGSANKNVGDAFLVSWLLEDETGGNVRFGGRPSQALIAKHNQADKALLSVVKICIALCYDDYYIQTMSENARTSLLNKIKGRPGPVVQMGFGLHAGKAVQGALGSERKIDATYVSEAVERAEFLESSTKQYGLQMLMSDTFHRLLSSSNRRRCRKIDQIMFVNEDEEQDEQAYDQGDVMELYTFDMDIDALKRSKRGSNGIDGLELDLPTENDQTKRRSDGSHQSRGSGQLARARRRSVRNHSLKRDSSESDEKSGSFVNEMGSSMAAAASAAAEFGSTLFDVDAKDEQTEPDELILPAGPAQYRADVWLQEDMRRIRQPYTSVVFQTFDSGLQKYYNKDWAGARKNFEAILERFEDGPSKYFLRQMEKFGLHPPPNFQPCGKA